MAWGRLALLQAEDEQALSKLADVFGYTRLPEDAIESNVHVKVDVPPITLISPQTTTAPQRPPARFLRINKLIKTETDRNDDVKPAYLSDPDMRLKAQAGGTYRFAPPRPLMPIARLLPLLFNSLAQARTGHSLDYRQLIKQIGQGNALQRLPKRQHRRWPQRLQIIVDASPRLEPYWTDFEGLVRQQQTLLGQEAVQALRFDEDTLGEQACYCLPWPAADTDQWQRWQTPPADVSVLILGDLGVGDDRATIAWQRQLACLQSHPSPILTLSPVSGSSEDRLFCQQFKPNAFNDQYPVSRHPVRNGFSLKPAPTALALDDMLIWLSPLPLIDTGLLRRLRVEMHWGSSDLEAVLWNHPAMRDIGLGKCVQPEVAGGYQQRFQKYAGTEKAKLFWNVLEGHHTGAYEGLRQLETFKRSVLEQQDDSAVREYFKRLCAMGLRSGSDPAQQHALRMQCRTVLASMPTTIWNSDLNTQKDLEDLAYVIYATAHEAEIKAGQWPKQLPDGFDIDRLRWVVGGDESAAVGEMQGWQIVQVGAQGQIKIEPCSFEDDPVVTIFKTEVSKAFPPRLILADAKGSKTHPLQKRMTVTLSENETAVFEARGLKLELEAILKPSWASRIGWNEKGLTSRIPWLNQELEVLWQSSTTEAKGSWRWPTPFGEDTFGLYVDLSVKNVTQRFRWLKPGNFWMGSPEDEEEREWNGHNNGKGSETLRQVTLTQGFWLADTTVTQAFWQAVMGNNPSHFKDNPEHPVEQVSWHDTQLFIDRLNGLLPGLSARLPSDAEWEYACRAEKDTPFSFGTNITPEQVNYDGSYPYSGGEKGLYRGKTVPVKSLPANPWGFYEMHGNVWEWCADVWQQQLSSEPVTDPLITGVDGDSARVVRGGSWFNDGRSVRSAFRRRLTPGFRGHYLGFRLALGHAELQPGQGSGTTAPVASDKDPGRRVAEQRQTGSLSGADDESPPDGAKRLTD